MQTIRIDHRPKQEQLKTLGVFSWPVWTKEASEFLWTYDAEETCYFLDGEVIVAPEDGEPVRVGKGDLAVFPKGMSCTWKVLKEVRKHYRFG